MKTRFQKLLDQAFLEWCSEKGAILTKKDWAAFLGINYSQMSHYFSGRREPTGSNLTKLTLAIGPRVLTSLDLIKDPMLRVVLDHFHELPEKDIERIFTEASRLGEQKNKESTKVFRET